MRSERCGTILDQDRTSATAQGLNFFDTAGIAELMSRNNDRIFVYYFLQLFGKHVEISFGDFYVLDISPPHENSFCDGFTGIGRNDDLFSLQIRDQYLQPATSRGGQYHILLSEIPGDFPFQPACVFSTFCADEQTLE